MIRTSDIYKEIFSRLATLKEEPYGYSVYDEAPKNPSNPHIRVDYSYNIDKSGNGYEGTTYYQYVHVFSTYSGRKEVLQMADDIIETLSEDIETDEFIAYSYLERNEISVEDDNYGGIIRGYNINGTYRHAIIVFKYIIYKK